MTTGAAGLPAGVVTFLFSDLEGSTRLARELGDEWTDVLAEHNAAVRDAIGAHRGVEVRTMGDGFFVAFASPADAAEAACAIQRRLAAGSLACRIGLHTGAVAVAEDDYVGLAVHQAARVAAIAAGGQVLATEPVRLLAGSATFRPLGAFAVRDFGDVNLFEVVWDPDRPPATPRAPAADRVRVPKPANRLVGRNEELGELQSRLTTHRLVTIVGPGGAGKTRIAVEAARDAPTADAVWFVDLTAAADDGEVAAVVAAALELQTEDDPTDEVVAALGDREVLVVLDNGEHVVDGAAALAQAILAGTSARLLATSREALAVSGEVVFELPPLDPSAAVDLFSERAAQAGRDVGSGEHERGAIAALCGRLDGLPLAVELAASLTRTLPVDQIADRLDDRFGLLQSRARDRSSRQRTLWATVDWSYGLLDDDERAALRRLSVFAGGFSIEAAEQVIGGRRPLQLIDGLVAKSLVATNGERLRLLETIRDYALERLRDEREESDARRRHLGWAEQVTAMAHARLLGPEELTAFRTFDAELPNIRTAIEWGIDHDPELALRTIGNLYGYAGSRPEHAGLLGTIERALHADAGSGKVRARAHAVAAFLCGDQGDWSGLERHASSSLSLLGDGPDDDASAWTAMWTLTDLAFAALDRGAVDEAEELLRRALDVETDDVTSVVRSRPIEGLGLVLERRGRTEEADAMSEAAIDLLRQRGLCNGRCYLLSSLASSYARAGRMAEAAAALEEGLVAAEQMGERRVLLTSAIGLAGILAALGRDEVRIAAVVDRALEIAVTDGLQQLLHRRVHDNVTIARVLARPGPDATRARIALDVYERVAVALGDGELLSHVDEARRAIDDLAP
jgi:predicted ATPase/class 3 adenylate cyclase